MSTSDHDLVFETEDDSTDAQPGDAEPEPPEEEPEFASADDIHFAPDETRQFTVPGIGLHEARPLSDDDISDLTNGEGITGIDDISKGRMIKVINDHYTRPDYQITDSSRLKPGRVELLFGTLLDESADLDDDLAEGLAAGMDSAGN